MSKYSTLKAEIIASIKRNGAQAITGDLLQEKLLSMIDSLGEHYQFGGLALPSTEFTAGDEPVVFIAATPGTYTNFGGLVVADGEVALLVWSGSAWSKQTTDIATRSEVSQLGQKVGDYITNSEFFRAYTDSNGKVLWGIKVNGDIYFGAGAPRQVKDYIAEQIENLGLSDYVEIADFLGTLIEGDNLQTLLDEKVDKEDGKSLIDSGVASSQSIVTSPEFVKALTDSNGRVIFGIDLEGNIRAWVHLDGESKEISAAFEGLKDYVDEQDATIESQLADIDPLPTGGNNGEVLKTDGNGHYYWATVPTTTTTDVSQTFGVLVDQYEELNTGISWRPAIQAAVNAAGIGGTIVFTPNKTYNIDGTISMKKDQVIIGNGATLRRMNESKAIVAQAVPGDGTTNQITVDSIPDDWSAGYEVYIVESAAQGQLGRYLVNCAISSVDRVNNIVTFYGIGIADFKFTTAIPEGSIIVKNYPLLRGAQGPVPVPYKVFNLKFDGNKDNNNSLFRWSHNITMYNFGHGSVVEDCQFYDIPGENIVAQGIIVRGCYAKNLNGSLVHLSCPPTSNYQPEQNYVPYMGTFVVDNMCEDILLIDESAFGHNLSPVTYSWNPGKLVVIGNQFYGSNKNKCIYMDARTPDDSIGPMYGGDMRRAVYIGNLFENFPKIGDIPLVTENPTTIKTRIITNNIFKDCGTSDMQRLYSTDLMFENNLYDNTVVNTGGNSLWYRIDTDFSATPSASAMTTKYGNLPIGGKVYITQISKLYEKVLTGSSTIVWTERSISALS